jgi:hypothetical protein
MTAAERRPLAILTDAPSKLELFYLFGCELNSTNATPNVHLSPMTVKCIIATAFLLKLIAGDRHSQRASIASERRGLEAV